MTPLAVAVTIVAAIVIGYRLGARRRPAPRHCPESYWAGYRRNGHDDGQLFRAVLERTPSPN